MNPEVGSRTGNFIRKTKALWLIGLLTVGAACGTNRGDVIRDCGDDKSDIRATFEAGKGYKDSTNPNILNIFADSAAPGLGVYESEGGYLGGHDNVDKMGEIACFDENGIVFLTKDGAILSYVYEREGFPVVRPDDY